MIGAVGTPGTAAPSPQVSVTETAGAPAQATTGDVMAQLDELARMVEALTQSLQGVREMSGGGGAPTKTAPIPAQVPSKVAPGKVAGAAGPATAPSKPVQVAPSAGAPAQLGASAPTKVVAGVDGPSATKPPSKGGLNGGLGLGGLFNGLLGGIMSGIQGFLGNGGIESVIGAVTGAVSGGGEPVTSIIGGITGFLGGGGINAVMGGIQGLLSGFTGGSSSAASEKKQAASIAPAPLPEPTDDAQSEAMSPDRMPVAEDDGIGLPPPPGLAA